MTRFLIYLLFFGTILYLFSAHSRRLGLSTEPKENGGGRRGGWFRPKKNPQEVWIQVYETASMTEARALQARLQEEDLECVLYEQGKKDIHGNMLKGIGIAVPRTSAPHAQRIISQMPV